MNKERPAASLRIRSLAGIAFASAVAIAISAIETEFPVSAANAADAAVTAAYSSTLGGPGHAAMYPSGMEIVPTNATTTAAGTAGDVIIADTGNDQIAEYTATGTQVWRVGSEGSGAPCSANPSGFPQFQQPRDVGVDSSGNIYVADNGNGRVMKLSGTTGKCMLKPFKMPGGGAPIGVTVSTTPSGQLVYVANGTKSQIDVFSTTGATEPTINSQGACVLNHMRDAAADSSGNVYVANYTANNILEFNAAGNCVRTWGKKGNKVTTGVCSGNVGGTFKNPYGVAIGSDPYINGGAPGEAIYVADSNDDCIQEFTPTGTFVADFGSPGDNTQSATFTQLRRVAVDANGNVWGADLWGDRAVEFTRSAGGYTYSQTIPNPIVEPGDTDTSVFNQVRGISFDSSGDLVAMDTVNQRVVVFNSAGQIINMCGQRGFTDTGDFNWPRGVAVDPATGNYWIADTKQSDLQVLQPTAPNGCNGLAEFGKVGTPLGDDNYPYSIAIDNGYAWIADTKNNRVESWKVSTEAAVSTYGTNGSGTGQFTAPAGVGIDPATHDLFVADSVNNRVVELSVSNGVVGSVIKTYTDGFNKPYGVASNGHGLLAVADRTNNRVVILNESDGSQSAVITASDVTGGGPTTLFNPENVAFGPNGTLYIADTYNDRILAYTVTQTTQGYTTPTFDLNVGKAGKAFVYPFGIALDPTSDTLLVDDYVNYNVKRFALDGTYLESYSSKGAKTGQFSEQPSEIAVDPTDGSFVQAFAFNGYGYMKFDATGKYLFTVNAPVAYYAPFIAVNTSGEVYLVQSTGIDKSAPNIVLMYDHNGTALGQFGTNGTNCAKGQFGVIRGIDVDNYGNVFVNDVSNHCIQVFTSSGQFEGYFGNKTQLSANTRGLKLDRTNGVVYVADAANEWVVAYNNLTYSGTTFTGATWEGDIGTPGLSVGSSCGGNGELDAPRDIAVGPDGTVYVTDYACWIVDAYNPLFDSTSPGLWLDQIPDPSIPAPPGGLNSANGVAVGPDGTIYVADTFNQRIQEFAGLGSATPGAFVQQWGSRLPTLDGPFSLDYPRGVSVDPVSGDVWVSDTRSGYIKQYSTSTGAPPSVAFDSEFGGEGYAPGQFFYSDGIAVASAPPGWSVPGQQLLYIPDSGYGLFQVTDESGDPLADFRCGTLVEPDVFNGCTGVAVDAHGDIYAPSFNDGVVDVFAPTAIGTSFPFITYTETATLGVTAPGGALSGPYGVAISGNRLYVTQSTNNDVSTFDISGGPAGPFPYLGSWGTKGTANGQFNRPLGIATDSAGNIYVDDYGNSRVSVFKP